MYGKLGNFHWYMDSFIKILIFTYLMCIRKKRMVPLTQNCIAYIFMHLTKSMKFK